MKQTSSWLLAAALGLTAQAAHSASITVDAGGNCTLGEAITSANNDSATGNGCVDGSGSDIITLQTNVTLAAALPDISSAITIEGGGKTINGNGGNFSVLKIVSGGNLTLNNATITGGHPLADNGGGIYANTGSTVILNSCTVSGNTADSMGGGIFAAGTTSVTLNNSTVSGNTCISGGGIGAGGAGATVILNNSTVSGNSSTGIVFGGGGICVIENGASVTLRSSIVSNNNAVAGNEVYTANSGTVIAASYNVFGHSGETDAQAYGTNGVSFAPGSTDVNATSNGTNTPIASILNTSLAANGGPTQTHALVAGSPAVDLGAAACPDNLLVDQRGYTRPINFKCDAGAVEYSPSFSLVSGNGRDLPTATWLMTAPACVPANPPGTGINAQYGDDISGGSYGTNWIGYAWDAAATPQRYVQLVANASLTPGNGNWLYSTIPATLTLTGTATPAGDCATYGWAGTNCFAVDLERGTANRWNMVGHPFPYAVGWDQVRIAAYDGSAWTLYTPSAANTASIVDKNLYRWTGSSYETKDDTAGPTLGTLQPQEAVWVRSLPGSGALTDLKLLIPAQ